MQLSTLQQLLVQLVEQRLGQLEKQPRLRLREHRIHGCSSWSIAWSSYSSSWWSGASNSYNNTTLLQQHAVLRG